MTLQRGSGWNSDTRADEPLDYDKFQTSLLIRRDRRWMIAAAQVTAISDRSKERYQSDPNG